MTITSNGNGSYTLQLNATEQAQLARALRRHGAASLRDLITSWLERSGGPDEKLAELRDAYLAASPAVQAQVDAALGVA